MFEKQTLCNIDEFETHSFGLVAEGLRTAVLDDGTFLLISNSSDSFSLNFYSPDGNLLDKKKFDRRFGQLAGIRLLAGALWLEFHEYAAMYEEIYRVVRVNPDGSFEPVFSSVRESYNHNLAYHGLFCDGKDVFCNIIRHNRLHQYLLTGSSDKPDEVNIQEGGKWFLCESHPLCLLGGSLEIYDPGMEIINTVDFDYEIDEIFLGASANPGFLALVTTDHAQGNTFLIVHINDTRLCSVSFIESAISAMGVSAGKIWLNPCSYDPEQDFGGIAVYDRYAMPIYIHLRGKGLNSSFGAYPPPFYRSSKIIPAADSTTLIVEANKAILFDYAGRAIQEIPIAHPDLIAVSSDGTLLTAMQTKTPYKPDNHASYKNAAADFYSFNSKYDGDKVVDIAQFREREN
jgi:hypothetical protein